MKLYGHPLSSNTRRVQMLCEELKIPYEYRKVDLSKGEQNRPEYLKLNPNGKVPALDDNGFVLWESQAILRYLAVKHGAATWYPTNLKKRAAVEQWLDWHQSRLAPEVGKLAMHTLFLGAKASPQAIEDAKSGLAKILPVMENALARQPYVASDNPTLADLAIASTMAYLDMCRFDLSAYPRISDWFGKMKARPSFKATAAKGA